jgi:hypothetical protein
MQLKLHYTNNPLTATKKKRTRSLAPELENFVRARATAAAGIKNTQSTDSRREDQAAACKGASEGKGRFSSAWKVAGPRAEKVWKNGVIWMSG